MSLQLQQRGTDTISAISDTGPLISAFQSESVDLLMRVFPRIFVSPTCLTELKEHGWEKEIQSAGSRVIRVTLTDDEHQQTLKYATQIAQHPATHNLCPEEHFGEAEAMVIARRPEHHKDVLLVDELAARYVAKQAGVKLSGFPGVLLLAVQRQLISAEELKARLEMCREQGTHYGVTFIEKLYNMAKQGRRKS